MTVCAKTRPQHLASHVAVALMLLGGSAEVAASWEFRASQGLSYTDNLLRTAPGQEVSDWESATTLGGVLALDWRRQQLRLDTSVTRYQYRQHDDRDRDGNQIRLNWNWSSVNALSGQLGLFHTQSLYTYGGGLDITDAATTRQRGYNGQVRLGNQGPFSATLATQRISTRYSLDVLDAQATSQQTYTFTLGWRSGARTDVQWVNSHSSTEAIYATATGVPESRTLNSQLVLSYVPSARTQTRFTLGWSRLTTSQGQSTPQTVGGIQLTWLPTARTTVSLGWQRDARSSERELGGGSSSNGTPNPTFALLDEQSVSTQTLNASWQATARGKLSLAYSRQDSQNSSLVKGGELVSAGQTDLQRTELSWSHTFSQAWQTNCGWRREALATRGGISRPYQVATTYCTLALNLRD